MVVLDASLTAPVIMDMLLMETATAPNAEMERLMKESSAMMLQPTALPTHPPMLQLATNYLTVKVAAALLHILFHQMVIVSPVILTLIAAVNTVTPSPMTA